MVITVTTWWHEKQNKTRKIAEQLGHRAKINILRPTPPVTFTSLDGIFWVVLPAFSVTSHFLTPISSFPTAHRDFCNYLTQHVASL
jgi:hypothetical protein